MDGDQSVGEHADAVEPDLGRNDIGSHLSEPTITSAAAPPDISQSPAKTTSDALDQPKIPVSHSLDGGYLDTPTADVSLPTSGMYPASSLPGLAHEMGNAAELGTNPFPEFMGGLYPHEHASGWPVNDPSDGSYQASHPYPPESVGEPEGREIQAFAKLEFNDVDFYMNTYSVELGRDLEAAREADEREQQLEQLGPSATLFGDIQLDPVTKDNGQNGMDGGFSGGLTAGGVITSITRKKIKSNKSKSSGPSSRQLSRKSSMHFDDQKTDYNALVRASSKGAPPATADFETGNSLPPPDYTPLIPIHPSAPTEPHKPGDSLAARYRNISRKAVRISFDFVENLFKVEFLGRNGGFLDEQWYAQGNVVPLASNSIIQVGGVGVRFVLPNVPPGETGAEEVRASDPPSSDTAGSSKSESEREKEEESPVANVKHEERPRERGKKKTEVPPQTPVKRKGPGRPPKNGHSSQREIALIAKQAKEEAKAKAAGKSIVPPVQGKGLDGKDTKNFKGEENNLQPNGKRKYTKRRRAGGNEDQQAARESTEHTDSVPRDQGHPATVPPKPTKEKKPAKPPRSPSPVFDESKLTPEQLTKPQSSYVVLIHEALTNSSTGQMSLPQIYRAIERRYPFYKLRVQTQGWQSSVRHNLSQHPAFQKIERDGKGWMWGLVPEVSIEKEKKRRATPPISQQPYYQPGPMMQHPYTFPGMPGQNGHVPGLPYNLPLNHPSRMPYIAPPRPGFPLPLATAQSESTYRSPYQSNPPPSSTPSALQPQEPKDTTESQQIAQSALNNVNNPAPTSTNSSPSSHPPGLSKTLADLNQEEVVKQAISKFKASLITNLDDKVRGETLVTSAVNRVYGLQPNSSLSREGDEDPDERIIMNTFKNMIGNLSERNSKENMRFPGSNAAPSSVPRTPNENHHNSEGTLASTAIAAEKAAKIALTDGHDAAPLPSLSPKLVNRKSPALNNGGGTKRSLEPEAGIGSKNNSDQSGPKRVASGSLKT